MRKFFLVSLGGLLFLVLAVSAVVTALIIRESRKSLYEWGMGLDSIGLETPADWIYKRAADRGDKDAVELFFDRYIHEHDISPADYPFVHRLALSRAKDGAPLALVALGLMHERGDDTGRNIPKAMECYQKAMDKNFSEAFVRMGDLWLDGRVGEKSFDKAFEFYSKAADAGDSDPLVGLGFDLYEGRGMEKDLDKASKCFKKAVEKKDPLAMNALAYAYAKSGAGSLDEAEALVVEALKAFPENPCFIDTHGYVLFKKGSFKEALELCLKADRLAEKEKWNSDVLSEIKEHVADAYEKLGDAEKAKEYRAASKALASKEPDLP